MSYVEKCNAWKYNSHNIYVQDICFEKFKVRANQVQILLLVGKNDFMKNMAGEVQLISETISKFQRIQDG